MKLRKMRNRIIILALWCLTMMLVTACVDKKIPAPAEAFINQNFPKSSIVLVETDTDDEGMEYCVWLNDGTKVEFDMQGNWKRVARKKTGVPTKMIPDSIMGYIKTKYPGNVVTKFSKKPYGYKIELSDDMDLRFNNQGHFIEEID